MSCWAVSVSAKDMPWWRSAVGSPFSSRAAELLRHGFGLPANAASGRAWIVPLRAVEATAERTLALFAAGSCVAATTVLVLGFWLLSQVDNPLGAIFQIVPPIGF